MTAPGLTAQAVADLVGGRLLGDGEVVLRRVGPLDRATGDTLSFLVSGRYLPYFRASAAGAVLLPEAFAAEPAGPATRIVVADPHRALLAAVQALFPPEPPAPGIDPTARLGPGTTFGADVTIGAYAVLGRNVRLGDRCRIGPGAVLEDGVTVGPDSVIGPRVVCCTGTRVGARVVVKAGAVLGGDGFGYVADGAGHRRLPHVGGCIIEDDVEVGSQTCIDRGSVDDTVVGRGTKIDNLVQIGHNVRIGQRCLIAGQVGIGGSARIGDDVIIAGGVGVAHHVQIGDGARVTAASGLGTDVPPGKTYGGFPAREHREFLRAQAAMYRLAPIASRLESLVTEREQREHRG
ncbi:MAG TPA: UDP-3-O-(3-hydroxymyristoyl)glucosamine N-acyltransferase [Gemmatimonadales bacterium]|nr:UDP-3-O-(3-hydroxymyristoyl)glucosamine N-acyltransferase [Gemmatimonadales bacterium]